MALDLRQQLSKNFTLNEMIQSSSAVRHGIPNIPTAKIIENLRVLCVEILQPVRDYYNLPMKISSGYRSPAVNSLVGGSPTSDHCRGFAADIEVPSISNYQLAKYIESNFKYTQLILEFYTRGVPDSGWVHISYDASRLKNQSLTAKTGPGGLTGYHTGLLA
jgi:zinc D-Ala-D-Ala carboxypeptidase